MDDIEDQIPYTHENASPRGRGCCETVMWTCAVIFCVLIALISLWRAFLWFSAKTTQTVEYEAPLIGFAYLGACIFSCYLFRAFVNAF